MLVNIYFPQDYSILRLKKEEQNKKTYTIFLQKQLAQEENFNKNVTNMTEKEIEELVPGYTLDGNPDECIFMIHGFTGSAPELYPLAKLLNEKGYSVMVHALPGHGTSSLEALRKTSAKDWMNSVKEGYEKATKKYKKVYVFGYSMGGALAITLIKEHTLDGLILCEPALIPSNKFAWVSKILRFTPMKIEWGGEAPSYPDHAEKYWHGQSGYYLKSASDLLTVSKKAKKLVSQILCPVMMTWAEKDESIAKKGVDLIAEKAPSNIKTYKTYPNNTHHLPSEPEKESLAKDIDVFIKKTIPVK